MIYNNDCTLPKEYLEQLTEEGLESLPEMIRLLVNQAMQIERDKHLNARPYERNDERNGYANGYKPKTVKTRVGEVTFDIPQVREGGFYPEALEKGLRSERALLMALAEMYACTVPQAQVYKEYPPAKLQLSPRGYAGCR
jgi:putative transposase